MGGNQLGRGWSAIGGWGIKLLGVGRGGFFFIGDWREDCFV